MERALLRPKYDRSGKPPKIVIAESWFARGVTRDQDDRRGVDDADVDAFIAGRLEQDYGGMVRIFVLDGRNSSRKEQILREFDACEEPAALVTLTAVSGEGLDISCASDGILVTPTETSAKEEQLSRRMNRFGQEQDVHLQVLQLANSIEQGVAEYAVRKAELVEEYLNGRPLTAEEMQLLEDDTARVNTGGFLAYEVMSPREKVMWIISRMYGKGKDAIREFFELDGGKYARDIAQYYPLEEATSYPGNTARLLCALLEKHMPDHPVAVADIACGCRTMERMFSEKPNVAVTSLDINKAMLDVGNQLLQKGDETREEEVRTMDELPFDDNTQDFAVLSLALHYTRHNPRMRAGEAGRERINALCEMNRVLKEGGIGILTFPTNAFPDKESFDLFCAVFEQYLGFQIIHESSDFATSMDNQGSEEEPFGVWVLSIKKIGEPKIEEMDQAAWEALSFTKLRGGSRANAGTLFGQRDAEEGSGAYHEEFALGGESLRFMPTRVDEVEQRDEYQRERDRYGRLHDRLEKLLRDHHSIQEIPDEMLLSISLEEVSESTQSERDEYFRVLLEHYRDINRVPVEDISSESPVILIRNESRRGPFLCLGRIDGTTRKPCGFGRRYFYTEHISGNANRGMDTNS
jgi:SAM-dependent methyltransferase